MAAKKKLLSFISDENLYSAVKDILDVAQYAAYKNEDYIYRNAIDPFSALFDTALQNITLKEWLGKEASRQIQKTLQNTLGDFHQTILGSLPGWENLERGHVFDIRNTRKMIIAEIKNKYNTTKGNHKTAIYDDLKAQLDGKYKGYVAYYVEVIPQNKKTYNKEFTPPDNRTKTQRPGN
ncbi:MAG: Eco47II family restriction endonuclease, partial [Patescibacteria group bacterium]